EKKYKRTGEDLSTLLNSNHNNEYNHKNEHNRHNEHNHHNEHDNNNNNNNKVTKSQSASPHLSNVSTWNKPFLH
ncbi:hypothetical protein PFDG_05034, partial [Plasmodium falciparum Dd2]